MMTCTFAEERQLRQDAPTVRSPTGTSVPSTIHNHFTAGSDAGAGPIADSGRMTWRTRVGGQPRSGASYGIVTFVRQYTATSSTCSAGVNATDVPG